jgi:ribosomal protein S18 acetylase RimI-like enzyme/predicted nucleotidyltransferase
MKFITSTQSVIAENLLPPTQIDEMGELGRAIDDGLNKELKVPADVLDSFKIKDTLNPELWDNFKLHNKVRTNLLKIAKDFMKIMVLPKDTVIKDIIFTGSLANYNWSKFSDVDLHIVLDYEQFDGDPEMIDDYFWTQKQLWNTEHDIKMFEFPVEISMQNSREELTATAVYSLVKDKWVKKPLRENYSPDISAIKKKANAFLNGLKNVRDDIKDGKFETATKNAEYLRDKLYQMRRAGLEKGGELSQENLVFKTLRRTQFLELLNSYKAKAYDNLVSINENAPITYKYKKKDEDTFYILAKAKGLEVGYIICDEMVNAYYYFDGDISQDEYDEIFPEDKFVRINWLKVVDGHRGQGIAKFLIQKAIDKIKSLGYSQVFLNASPVNDGSNLPLNDLVALYESFGFKTFKHQGGNALMVLNLNNLNEVREIPYDDRPEMKSSSYTSLSKSQPDLLRLRHKMAKAAKVVQNYKQETGDDTYFADPTIGDGFYQVEIRHDGQVRTKHVRPSGDMSQLGGSFQPSDLGTCKAYQNIARYCFVKAGKNGTSVGVSPAEDAANKAMVIFQQEIKSFIGDDSYVDPSNQEYSASKMDDRTQTRKQKKDLEMKLKRSISDREFQRYLETGQEPKPRETLSMSPEAKAQWQRDQEEKQKRIEILKAKMQDRMKKG